MPSDATPTPTSPDAPAGPAVAGRRWSPAAKGLHWLMAVLIGVQFPLGWLAAAWPLSVVKLDLFVWHKSLGMLALALVLLRLGVRFAGTAPPPPADSPPLERAAARASHAMLYALMLALPLSGWVINAAAGIPFRVFRLWPLPAIVDADRHTATVAATMHLAFGLALAAVVAVHVIAALRHHFVRHDEVLVRMLPKRKAKS